MTTEQTLTLNRINIVLEKLDFHQVLKRQSCWLHKIAIYFSTSPALNNQCHSQTVSPLFPTLNAQSNSWQKIWSPYYLILDLCYNNCRITLIWDSSVSCQIKDTIWIKTLRQNIWEAVLISSKLWQNFKVTTVSSGSKFVSILPPNGPISGSSLLIKLVSSTITISS